MTDCSAMAGIGNGESHQQDKVVDKPKRLGHILTVRHGPPDVKGRKGPRISSQQYIDWWADYEKAPLAPGQSPVAELTERAASAVFLFASPRPRSLQSARILAADRCIRTDDLFVECPLPLPWIPTMVRFSPCTWGFISRLIWLMGYSGGQESARQAPERARRAAQLLTQTAQTGDDVVLVAHGWFNHSLHRHIVAAGWMNKSLPGSGLLPSCNAYWGHRLYEYAPG